MAALYFFGGRKQPRTAARRIGWMIVTLVPLAAFAFALLYAAVTNWVAIANGDFLAPSMGETIALTVGGAFAAVIFVITLVLGTIYVREQRAAERVAARERGATRGSGARG